MGKGLRLVGRIVICALLIGIAVALSKFQGHQSKSVQMLLAFVVPVGGILIVWALFYRGARRS